MKPATPLSGLRDGNRCSGCRESDAYKSSSRDDLGRMRPVQRVLKEIRDKFVSQVMHLAYSALKLCSIYEDSQTAFFVGKDVHDRLFAFKWYCTAFMCDLRHLKPACSISDSEIIELFCVITIKPTSRVFFALCT